MQKYVIRGYEKGFEADQARIGLEVARHWIWPYAYHLDGLMALHSQPDFDPETRHYCFIDGQMVGYMFSTLTLPVNGGVITATMDFPRLLAGHEPAAGLLIEKALEALRRKGVSRVFGRVTTMCPEDIRLAEAAGFDIHDWGYKMYYSYETARGRLNLCSDGTEEIDPETDLDACSELAALWYGRPAEWCRMHLQEWHAAGVIAHAAVRDRGRITAACMAAPNDVRPSTAAIYYIHAPDEETLQPMLVHAVNRCVEYGVRELIADLINAHRAYEFVYRRLGFKKAADWARCELDLE